MERTKGKVYRIEKNNRILIYGASFIGRQIHDSLLEEGIEVFSFLDRDAVKFSDVKGKKVYYPDDSDLKIDTENDIVIIAVTDQSEHVGIANVLYNKGYRKIIFSDAGGIGVAYDAILKNNEDISSIEIPYYEIREEARNTFYVETQDGYYTVDIPAEMLFFEDDDGAFQSVYLSKDLLLFYNFLEGREDIAPLLESLAERTDNVFRWIEEERVKYRHMSYVWETGELSTVFAYYIGKGRFAVRDGLCQLMFYIAKGYKKVRCRINEEDYHYFLQPEAIKKCNAVIGEAGISFVYTPILHPYYYDFPCKREECGHTRLMKICMYLCKHGIEVSGENVLDAGTYIGYFAQHMCRMGANVTAVEFDKTNYELAKNFNELVHCKDIRLLNRGIQDLDGDTQYKVTLLLSVLDWHIDTEIGLQIMKKVDEVTSGILIWESGDAIEKEKKWVLEHSSFNSYEKIADTFGTGRIREMGVFRRI